MKNNQNRRTFLKQTLAGAASLSPLMTMLASIDKLEAANVDGDYKAIVCVLLEGGADVCNMIAPTGEDAYNKYEAVRKNIALSKESLLALNNASYGMRDNMGKMQALYNDNKLAVIANVGTLVEPVTPQEVESGAKGVPFELFAHNTQRNQWMLGDATGSSHKGWGARMMDTFDNVNAQAYAKINTADVNTLLFDGGSKNPLHFDEAYISPDTMRTYGFGPESGGGDLGKVYQDLYEGAQSRSHKMMAAFAKRRVEKLNLPDKLSGLFDNVRDFAFDTGVHEVGRPLGKQLETVAEILSVKDDFPGTPKRQIFFVVQHGWDTHDSDNEHQVGYLSNSLDAFQKAVDELGLSNQVTTFTVSDFGRSLSPNGAGTDHGWGSHAFVMGGAVKGGQIYGTMPQIEIDSPDAWHDRLVPTTSMESYLATIVKWFGADGDDLDTIFPNLSPFPVKDMGFMG